MEYLAIKGWEKYQTGKGKMRWIKLETQLEEDDAILDLTVYQQGLLVMLWRLRGRTGRNLSADPLKLCRKLAIQGQERHNVVRAIGQLIVSGWLIPTNQQDGFLECPLEENKNREEENKNTGAAVLKLKLPEPPNETDGEAEFRKLLAVHPKPEDDHAAMVAFHDRILKNSLADKIPEAETLAKIHEAAALYRRLSDEGLIDFVYPMGSWLRKGICNHDPELWKGKNRAKRSLLEYDELPEFQKPV